MLATPTPPTVPPNPSRWRPPSSPTSSPPGIEPTVLRSARRSQMTATSSTSAACTTWPRAIAEGHQAILDSIYRGAPSATELERARQVAPGCIVAVVHAPSSAPRPPARHQPRPLHPHHHRRDRGLADQRLPQHPVPAYRLSAHDPLVVSGDEPNRPRRSAVRADSVPTGARQFATTTITGMVLAGCGLGRNSLGPHRPRSLSRRLSSGDLADRAHPAPVNRRYGATSSPHSRRSVARRVRRMAAPALAAGEPFCRSPARDSRRCGNDEYVELSPRRRVGSRSYLAVRGGSSHRPVITS